MSDQPLIIRDDKQDIVKYSPEVEKLREAALEVSALVGKVSNPDENAAAVAAQIELQKVIKAVDKAADELINNANKFKNKVWATQKKFKEELTPEMTRVSTLIGDYQALEAAKARAQAEAARLEALRIQQEQEAAERKVREAAEAEARRLSKEAAEAARKLEAAKTAEEAEKARRLQAEIEKQKTLAAVNSHEALDAVQAHYSDRAAAAVAAPSAPVRAEGQVVRTNWEITVTNQFDLVKFHPNCVTITPKLTEIKALLDEGMTVKGVTAKKIVTSGVVIPKQQAIDV